MRRIEQWIPQAAGSERLSLILPFEKRGVSRQRVSLSDGSEAGLFLPRGTMMRDGDLLLSDDQTRIRVTAAPEALLRVTAQNPQALMRTAYHLGNRHVPVEVQPSYLQLEYDYVLAQMLVGLGAQVIEVVASFEPEGGAYSGENGPYAGHGGGHRH